MKCVFIIQGEGRGHSTQAIALAEILRDMGVEVVAAYIGKNHVGRNHDWVFKEISVKPKYFYSPNFIYYKNQVSLPRTVLKFILNLKKTFNSIKYLNNELKQINPDFVVNFYEPLTSFAKYNLQIPTITIGHQFMIDHPSYPKELPLQRKLISLFNNLVSRGSKKIIALSFYPAKNDKNLNIAPPILRKEVLEAKPKIIKNKVVAYVVNPDLALDILDKTYNYPKCKFSIYNEKYSDCTFNAKCKLISPNFVEEMLEAEYVICSGGFETVSEAHYHNKKILGVPVKNHAEQILNTIDASRKKIIVTNNDYKLNDLITIDNKFKKTKFLKKEYTEWYINFFQKFFKEII
jgi:hypothetical protein